MLRVRAWLSAAVAAVVAGLLAWLRWDARRDEREEAKGADYERAEEINDAAADARRDHADGVRPWKDHGYRD